jgi:hypothetical protein
MSIDNSKYKPVRKVESFQLRWNEPLGKPECPYAYRWVLNFGLFALRVHHFVRSDDKRHFHDHGWWFLTFVLKGSYVDVSPDGRDQLRAGSIRFRKATHKHYVEVPKGGVWTFLITGSNSRKWGFWIGDKFKRPLKYFDKYGHPPCDEQ